MSPLLGLLLAASAAASGPGELAGVESRLEALRAARPAALAAVTDEKESYVLRLAQLAEADRLVRQAFMSRPRKTAELGEWDRVMSGVDRENTAELKRLLAEHGWPRRDVYPPSADADAWLLVQHADLDRAFQTETLRLLERLLPAGTDPKNHAYLHDRVAAGEGRPQRYGTQGRCRGAAWVPDELEDHAGVDARRAAAGIGPLAEYAARNSAHCGGGR